MPALKPDRLQAALHHLGGNSLLIVQGDTTSPVAGNQRTSAVAMHLLNSPVLASEVAILLTPTKAVVASKAGPASWSDAAASVPVTAASDADFIAAVKEAAGAAGGVLCAVPKELPLQVGTWATSLLSAVSDVTKAAADGSAIIAGVLNAKDDVAIDAMRKAGAVAAGGFKRFGLAYLQKELSKTTPPSQAEAAQAFTDVMNHPDKLEGLEQMDTENFAAAFDANVQCGPNFDLATAGANVSAEPLGGPVVCVAVGEKHRGYMAYCARTFLVVPADPKVKEAYEFLLAVYDKLFSLIRAGVAVQELYVETMGYAQTLNAVLATKLSKDFGFTTGLHFADVRGTLGPKGTLQVPPTATLVTRIALENVPITVKAETTVKAEPNGNGDHDAAAAPTTETRTFSFLVADTVIVTGGKTDYATKQKRGFDDVTFAVKVKKPKEEILAEYVPRVTRGAIAAVGLGLEEQRNEAQRRIFKKKTDEWIAAGSPKGVESSAGTRPEDATAIGRLARGALVTYPEGVPSEFKNTKSAIQVDRTRSALVLPIGGVAVPFHISTVTKVDVAPDAGGKHAMTVTFGTTQQSNIAFGRHRNRQWVKELTYVRADGGPLYSAMAAVKEVQKMLKDADAKSKQSAGLAGKVNLQQRQNAPRLPGVKMRPAPAIRGPKGGAIVGNLDAHANGFQFAYTGGQPVVIAYDNIKHFICQPARKDIIVVIHLTLKAPMLIGDKQHTDVQFYVEVIETSEAASNARRTHDEELEAEEKDEKRVAETNRQFASYARKVAELCPELSVEAPFKEVEFQGVGKNRMNRFRGNEHALWAVSELPFTVISVSDIEVVSLERVLPGQQTFDAMFIMKDYKTVQSIASISMNSLETLKDWMNQAEIVYFEGQANVAWPKLLKHMRDDEEWEAWGEEGWIQYIDPTAGDEEGGEDSDSDSDYEESDGDDDDSDEDEESGSEWAEEGTSSDPDVSGSDDSDASSVDSDDDGGQSESDDSRKKRPRGGKAAPPPQRKPPQPGRR
jgi:nucleosome binding factor SPN SPT16 subunit